MSLSPKMHAASTELISSLLRAERYPHPVTALELIETHISWVILTGPYAYKIKKPLNLGFLDFSSLAQRKFYCEEELRLNRRTAASIYLQVVPITGSAAQPQWDGSGAIIEYAVKMRQFAQSAQLDRLLARGGLSTAHMDAFARLVAEFHEHIAVAGAELDYGEPEQVLQPIEENFTQIRQCRPTTEQQPLLDELQDWSVAEYRRRRMFLAQRKQQGFIRECHGDMHLRNLAWIDDQPVAFDGIEFNANLRWIDVMSEVAFLVMDLQDRQQPALAQRFLNGYLERSGDYAGITLLPFYLVYRALVRAKVAAIRVGQAGLGPTERSSLEREMTAYLRLAQTYTQKEAGRLIIARGLSGSGKTTLTQSLLETLPAIRIRSDVERKRLAGLLATERAAAAPGEGIYTQEYSDRTYAYLLERATEILDAGYNVIVDATFLQQGQRERFRQLAAVKNLAFHILNFSARTETLQQRIRQRSGDASDADLTVLQKQLHSIEAFTPGEMPFVIDIDTETQTAISPDVFA
ncbi:MAG: AAA family ATPase [Gammaproteobacteria bacterium]